MPLTASAGSLGRSATITSGIPDPAATAAVLAVQISPNGLATSVTLMLGSAAWQILTTRRMALRRTGELQKCHNSTLPETSVLSLGPDVEPVPPEVPPLAGVALPAVPSVLVAWATGAVVSVAWAAAGAVVSVAAAGGEVGVALPPLSHAASTVLA